MRDLLLLITLFTDSSRTIVGCLGRNRTDACLDVRAPFSFLGRIRMGRVLCLAVLWAAVTSAAPSPASWIGVLHDKTGTAIAGATIHLHATTGDHDYSARTSFKGEFSFSAIAPGNYELSVTVAGATAKASASLNVTDTSTLTAGIELSTQPLSIRLLTGGEAAVAQASGGERLSSGEVSSLPLNERDFSQLLLLAAGTMTDTNGAANFTQQFAVNGQRGTAAVFAMDGADSTDPELGGATFTNLNVDAVQEIRSSSGWMPAEIGRGAAGFTDIITKSGTNTLHGSAFEFLRNSALDARNFFDRRSFAQPRRIPPFIRNEFGLTNGGPVVIPKIYNGRDKTFYFLEYQGFRQVLSATEVIPVPTADERAGRDTTVFPGDTLIVPVNPQI